ncbi:MAG: DUF222 domain-containing protein, partial [Gemmatimonadota bacterium]|nr:DUF222 domain-containing protein [Gemmatimonadota bacterium]
MPTENRLPHCHFRRLESCPTTSSNSANASPVSPPASTSPPSTLVAEFDRREGWADSFTSSAEWLAWRTGRTLAAARENVRVAHALGELPLTATAMKSGQLSYTKVRTMTRVAKPETEATLLEFAQSTSA